MLKSYDYLLDDPRIHQILDQMLDRSKEEAHKKVGAGADEYRDKPNAIFYRNDLYISESYLREKLNSEVDIPINERSYLYTLEESTRELRGKMSGAMYKHFPNDSIHMTGNFFYPYQGFMGWHTNSNHPGTRIYFSYSDEGNSSFSYYDRAADRVVVSPDNKGWTVRGFEIDPNNLLWHAVDCLNESGRFSFGFNTRRVLSG